MCVERSHTGVNANRGIGHLHRLRAERRIRLFWQPARSEQVRQMIQRKKNATIKLTDQDQWF